MTNILAVSLQKLGVIPKDPSVPSMTSTQAKKGGKSQRKSVKEEEGATQQDTITALRVRQRKYRFSPKLTDSDGK